MVLSPDLFMIVYRPISLECRILALSGTVIYARARVCVRVSCHSHVVIIFIYLHSRQLYVQNCSICRRKMWFLLFYNEWIRERDQDKKRINRMKKGRKAQMLQKNSTEFARAIPQYLAMFTYE